MNEPITRRTFVGRTAAVYEQAEAMVRTGMLGDITAIKCQWHVNTDGRRDVPVSKEHPDFARLDRKLNWPLYRYASQGPVAEYGSHQLDVAIRMLGAAPQRVIAMGGVNHWRDGRENTAATQITNDALNAGAFAPFPEDCRMGRTGSRVS